MKKPTAKAAPKSQSVKKQAPMKRPTSNTKVSKGPKKKKKPLKMTPECVYSRAYHQMKCISICAICTHVV